MVRTCLWMQPLPPATRCLFYDTYLELLGRWSFSLLPACRFSMSYWRVVGCLLARCCWSTPNASCSFESPEKIKMEEECPVTGLPIAEPDSGWTQPF